MDSIKTLPWAAQQTPSGKAKIVDALGFSVVSTTSGPYDDQRKTAAFIVRAANSHDQLVAVVKGLLPDAIGNHIGGPDTQARIDAARAALAAAGA